MLENDESIKNGDVVTEIITIDGDETFDKSKSKYQISEENAMAFNRVVSQYFEGQGEANFSRRPLERCKEMIQRRARSSSFKRKITEETLVEDQEPKMKKMTQSK